jgi:hypothetical protein
MSQRATGTVQYGIRKFDLSKDRNGEQNYELIQAPNTSVISTLDVPDECRLHLGNASSPGLDLREYDFLKRDSAFGQVYLSNPTGATGTLRLLFGVDIEAERSEDVTVEQINSTVTTDLSSDIGRSVGTVRVEDVTPVTGSTGTTATDVTLDLGRYRSNVDWFVDVSGAATLTVEVRTDGGTWRQLDTVSYSSATTEVEQYETAFDEIRASVDANLNTLQGSAKGL